MSVSLRSFGQVGPVAGSTPGVKPSSFRAEAVRFGGVSPVKARRVLEHLDFTAVGASPVKQIAVIFSSLITWRLLAADQRRRASVSKRWNELRENLLRDLLGFAFWFLGVPVLQRVYLGAVSRNNPQLKGVLIRHEKTQAEKGVIGWLKANNPLSNRYIPSSQQVKDQMQQALNSLQKAGLGPSHQAYAETQAPYLNLIKHRNFATALGLGSTILLLGVGINLLNFRLTRNNVTKSDLGKKAGPTAMPGTSPAAPVGAMAAISPSAQSTLPLPQATGVTTNLSSPIGRTLSGALPLAQTGAPVQTFSQPNPFIASTQTAFYRPYQ